MLTLECATTDDAEQVADIVALASGGIVGHLLNKLIPGMSGKTILSAAFMKGEAPYNSDNVICLKHNGNIAGLFLSYPAIEHAILPIMESFVPSKRLNVVRPILERAVPDSLYINTFWVAPEWRNTEMGDALMLAAVKRCGELGIDRISQFCWNDDEESLQFFARHGFEAVEQMPREMIPLEGHAIGGCLMCKVVEHFAIENS